ncbi:hypothetical protein ACSQ67_025948 [Phaseolus vulgaris]
MREKRREKRSHGGRRRSKGRVRTKTVKKSSRQVIEHYYSRISIVAAKLCNGKCLLPQCTTMDKLDFANDSLPEIAKLSSPFGTSSKPTSRKHCEGSW